MKKPGVRLLITDSMTNQEKKQYYKFFVRHFGFELYYQITESAEISEERKKSVTLKDCINYARNKVQPSSILNGPVDMICLCTEDGINAFLSNISYNPN